MYLSKLLNTENRFVKSKENSILTKEVEYPLSMLVPPLLYIFDKKKKTMFKCSLSSWMPNLKNQFAL